MLSTLFVVVGAKTKTSSCHGFQGIRTFTIQQHFIYYKLRPKRVQISRGICTPGDRLDKKWIEVAKEFFVCKKKFFPTVFLDRNLKVKKLNLCVIWRIERRIFLAVKSEINWASDALVETTKTSLPCSAAVDQSAPIPFRFVYFCHAFLVTKYIH